MAVKFHYSIIMALIVTSCQISSRYFLQAQAQTDGTATYYSPPYTPSACYGDQDQGVMIAAANDAIWNNGSACGQFYEVICISGTNSDTGLGSSTVTVMIVDHCPSGCRGTIDLSQEAFASIADLSSWIINISYQKYV
ncbi:hypothetical protein Tsubulata_029537 [Turnera subulata]|uniref:Expansin-like EG45 domain-containing protein n=1 Tax=Turnera subulata TaxID=218843 RepID=A0A9Q0JP99_9ROSI|nr:hypothetical protein Tsubulata_029537 [Turnera subulata]